MKNESYEKTKNNLLNKFTEQEIEYYKKIVEHAEKEEEINNKVACNWEVIRNA